jgi:hypothetical protein
LRNPALNEPHPCAENRRAQAFRHFGGYFDASLLLLSSPRHMGFSNSKAEYGTPILACLRGYLFLLLVVIAGPPEKGGQLASNTDIPEFTSSRTTTSEKDLMARTR